MVSTAKNHRGEAVRNALLEAAAELLIEHGADLTLDEVAERAEVGRRTIFRYFATKDDLIAEAIRSRFRAFIDAIPVRDGRAVDAWLHDVARTIHQQNLELTPSFFEGVRRRREVRGITLFMDRPGRQRRHQRMEMLAQEAWSARGGNGAVPQTVAESFTLHLSVFASEALRLHCRLDVERMAELTVETLLALIDKRIADRPSRTRRQR